MVKSRSRDLDQALLLRLGMRRQHSSKKFSFQRNHKTLVLEREVSSLADQLRDIFFPQKIFIEPPDLREHLQIGEILRLKIFLRALCRIPRRLKLLQQLAISRIPSNNIRMIRLKQIAQRKPPLFQGQIFRSLARDIQERILRLS